MTGVGAAGRRHRKRTIRQQTVEDANKHRLPNNVTQYVTVSPAGEQPQRRPSSSGARPAQERQHETTTVCRLPRYRFRSPHPSRVSCAADVQPPPPSPPPPCTLPTPSPTDVGLFQISSRSPCANRPADARSRTVRVRRDRRVRSPAFRTIAHRSSRTADGVRS